jgi:hypothetical protein
MRRFATALRSRAIARFDQEADSWGPGWIRWPVGRVGWVIAALLVVKLIVTTWNCAVFDGITYDQRGLHVPRVRSAGLATEGRSYNPPLYYMAAAPTLGVYAIQDAAKGRTEVPKEVKRRRDYELLATLRWSNLGYLAAFYLAWIGCIFPRLIGDRRRTLIATLVLLAMPGYQKLATMAHPDNAFSALTAIGIATWLVLRDDVRPPGRRVYVLAVVAGLIALTRPFGVLPCAALLVACLLLSGTELGYKTLAFGRRAIACIAVTAALAGAWPAYQITQQGRLSDVYLDSYLEPYLPHRPGFDRVNYFLSFYPGDLLVIPNRNVRDLDVVNDEFHNKYGNSFWTLLYAETWSDHWLYFSGRYQVENKIWPKRVMLFAALGTIPLLLLGFARGVRLSMQRIRRWRSEPEWDKALFMLGLLALGVAMYLMWHLTDGLTPGKNSSVKFIYNAYLYPVGLAIAFLGPLRRFEDKLWPGYAILLFVVSLPSVFFVPRWML